MRPGHAVRQDERAGSGRKHDVHRPGREVLGDDGAQALRERRFGGDQGLFDVLAGVVARGKKELFVGVAGAAALADLGLDLLANLGFDGDGILLGSRDGHPFLLQVPVIIARRPLLTSRARLCPVRVLAVETSTLAGGVALLDGDRLRGEYLLDVRATHSERLMPAIDRLLADAGWAPGDLHGLADAAGPGSFAGLSIGMPAVKGLALALAIPIAPVPTRDALAARP